MKKSNCVPWLKTASGFLMASCVIGAIAIGIAYQESFGAVFAIMLLLCGIWSSFLLKIISELLEYMQHITKQLDDLYNQNEQKKHFDKTV